MVFIGVLPMPWFTRLDILSRGSWYIAWRVGRAEAREPGRMKITTNAAIKALPILQGNAVRYTQRILVY